MDVRKANIVTIWSTARAAVQAGWTLQQNAENIQHDLENGQPVNPNDIAAMWEDLYVMERATEHIRHNLGLIGGL